MKESTLQNYLSFIENYIFLISPATTFIMFFYLKNSIDIELKTFEKNLTNKISKIRYSTTKTTNQSPNH